MQSLAKVSIPVVAKRRRTLSRDLCIVCGKDTKKKLVDMPTDAAFCILSSTISTLSALHDDTCLQLLALLQGDASVQKWQSIGVR